MSRGESDKRAKLITLLNVAHARNPGKRKGEGEDWHEIAKRARKSSSGTGVRAVSSKSAATSVVAGDAEAGDVQDVPGVVAAAAADSPLREDDEDEDASEDLEEVDGDEDFDPEAED